ncbi:MAG: cobalt ECF transporter T component CbiQ [Chitinivibrionales bacterium]|nr:cobalt ECF transporter T component CbiQ [Chitinivibrionales bacterium]
MRRLFVQLEWYSPKSTFLHAWDTRWKLFSILLLIGTSASVTSFAALLALLLAAIILCALAHVTSASLQSMLSGPLFLCLIMLPVIALTSGGETLFQFGYLRLFREGILTATQIVLRLLTIVLLLVVLLTTTRFASVIAALQRLHVPGKLTLLIAYTYRFIFVLIDDLGNLMRAARLRGYRLQSTIMHFKTSTHLLVALLVKGYDQSERVQAAMTLRGFRGIAQTLEQQHSSLPDIFLTGAAFLVTVAAIALESMLS